MQLRLAQPDDAMAVARVHVRSWQVAYRRLLPDDYLSQLRPEDRAKSYDFASLDPLKPRTIVAAEAGLILGFATTMPSRDADLPDHGELCALYLDPDRWGQGIGAVLIADARAERFYRIDQWVADGCRRTDSGWKGIVVNEVRYQRGL